MHSKGYSTWSVCLFVCLFVYDYSRTTGYEPAYERYQQLQCNKGMNINVAILLIETAAFERYGVKTSKKAKKLCIMSTGLPRPGLARSTHRGRIKLLRGYISKSSAGRKPTNDHAASL